MRSADPIENSGVVAPESGVHPIDSTFGTPFDLDLIGLWTLCLKEVRRFLKVPGRRSRRRS